MQTDAEPVRSGERLLRMQEVQRRTGLSAPRIYALAQEGKFPRPVKLSSHPRAHASGWVEREIDGFIAERIRERDSRDAA